MNGGFGYVEYTLQPIQSRRERALPPAPLTSIVYEKLLLHKRLPKHLLDNKCLCKREAVRSVPHTSSVFQNDLFKMKLQSSRMGKSLEIVHFHNSPALYHL